MPPTPIVVLEIDDNTPATDPPFTNDVSMWSLHRDLNLHTRTAAETFRMIHETIGDSTFRGYPNRVALATKELLSQFVDENEVTWLTGAELSTIWNLLPKGDDPIERSVRMIFETINTIGKHFGPDRVRVVFAFI